MLSWSWKGLKTVLLSFNDLLFYYYIIILYFYIFGHRIRLCFVMFNTLGQKALDYIWGVISSITFLFVCVLHSYCLTGTHFMFVFISALSAGRHDATLLRLYWMPWRATLLSYVHFCSLLHLFFLFWKEAKTLWEKLPRKEASMGHVRETPHINQHWACKRNSPYKPALGM